MLKTTQGAQKALTQHYIQNGWLDNTQNPSEDELVRQALQRIKIDPSQYDMFLNMLHAIKGLDIMVKALTHSHGKIIFSPFLFVVYVTCIVMQECFVVLNNRSQI